MSSYRRPAIDAPVFRDEHGEVIDYGRRWTGSPPEHTYSVETHPQRFAPLHTVADALIAHLRDTYDVHIDEGVEVATDLLRPPFNAVLRAVRVRPNDPACAPLTFIFTDYPGLHLHAGLLTDFLYPVCGCDACDSTWEAEADGLERHVLAIVAGDYRESIERTPEPWVTFSLTYPDDIGTSPAGTGHGGRSRADDIPAARVSEAEPRLRSIPAGWAPWPRAACPGAASPSAPRD
ncbi:DUF6226 family protein [Microbacterium sp. NPDC089189]|uniref:DUF6226 family protein n=1 Tax=Microbacterium sp. NPDC089189 TaxID=3154972 RepID=UPI003418FC7E